MATKKKLIVKLKKRARRPTTTKRSISARPGRNKSARPRAPKVAKKATAKRIKKSAVRLPVKRKAAKKRNSSKRANSHLAAAKGMFEKFHGAPSTRVSNLRQTVVFHDTLAKLGKLVLLKVKVPGGMKELKFSGVDLACDPSGSQLEFLGGDQKINLADFDLAGQETKSRVVLGVCTQIEYVTRKRMDDFKKIIYFHKLGEDGGEMPTLLYDVLSRSLYLAGGDYKVEAPGIEN